MARGGGPRNTRITRKVNVIVLVLNAAVLGSRRGGSWDWGECGWGEWLSGDGVGFWKGLCSGVCNCGAGGGSKLRDGGVWKRKNPGKREVFRGLGQGG